ncbi:MAG: glycosyltransferase [archaeon]
MIHIIITSYNEPKATLRAVKYFLNQKIKDKFKIIVVDPFPEVERFLKKEIKNKNVEFFLDPGEGKGYALNLLFQEYGTGDENHFYILTDGDVYVSENAVEEILKPFNEKKVGCVTGRPVQIDSTKSKYEYWAEVAFKRIHQVRKRMSKNKEFFECSGYLFAIRDGVIFDFSTNTSEDSIIPYLFWKKGYRIVYSDKAEVYVKNPNNWTDWFNQKVRNIKAHENLNKIAPDMPRTKSLFNEIKEGAFFAILQPRSLKEFFWIIQFYFARLHIYLSAFKELKTKKAYKDGWRETEIESTKPLD